MMPNILIGNCTAEEIMIQRTRYSDDEGIRFLATDHHSQAPASTPFPPYISKYKATSSPTRFASSQ